MCLRIKWGVIEIFNGEYTIVWPAQKYIMTTLSIYLKSDNFNTYFIVYKFDLPVHGVAARQCNEQKI